VMFAAGYFLFRLIRSGEWSLAARLHYASTFVAFALFLVSLHYWNLLGYHYG
jgi:hypothetical protein